MPWYTTFALSSDHTNLLKEKKITKLYKLKISNIIIHKPLIFNPENRTLHSKRNSLKKSMCL